MSISLEIGGTDFTDYVVSAERYKYICDPIGRLTVELEPNLPRDITTYERVYFEENGTRTFSGFSGGVAKARLQIEVKLDCYDDLIKAKDYWFYDEYQSNGETVEHWVEFFLNMADITNYSIDTDESLLVYPGFGWTTMTALEAITQTLKMSPYQIYVDNNGVTRLSRLSKFGDSVKTNSEFMSFERTRDDSYLRNRAVVFGVGFSVDESRANPLLPGETRTVAIGSGAIYNVSTAQELASDLLDEFENPMDVVTIVIPGDSSIDIGQVHRITDSWSGYDSEEMVTSVLTRYDNETYETEITYGEKCMNFWGWDTPPDIYIKLFCSTWGDGVYKSVNDGKHWDATALTGNYVYDIHIPAEDEVWAACRDGVYHTTTAGSSWTKQVMGNPVCTYSGEFLTEADMYFTAVVTDPLDEDTVYCLAGDFGNHGLWIYSTDDRGLTWNSSRLI